MPTKKKKESSKDTTVIVAIIGALATIIVALLTTFQGPLVARIFQTPTVTTQVQASPTESSALISPTETLSPTHPNPSPGSDLQPGSTIKHVVTTGESLLQIAHCYGADFEEVRNANPQISDPKNLSFGMPPVNVPHIGSVGEIYGPPCATFYNVQSGDTWESMADRYKVDSTVLRETNENIPLTPGIWIIIPSNSTLALFLTPPVTHEDEVDPNIADPYAFSILPGQVMSIIITNTTSKVSFSLEVHDKDEVFRNMDDMDIWGFPNAESGTYEIRIFNKTSSTIPYTLEVKPSR